MLINAIEISESRLIGSFGRDFPGVRRRFEEVANEEIGATALAVGTAPRPMARPGKDDQLEVFVGFNQRVNDLHRARGIHIFIQLRHGEQQFPLKVYDEDGTILGEYYADLVVEEKLILELKAQRGIAKSA